MINLLYLSKIEIFIQNEEHFVAFQFVNQKNKIDAETFACSREMTCQKLSKFHCLSFPVISIYYDFTEPAVSAGFPGYCKSETKITLKPRFLIVVYLFDWWTPILYKNAKISK